MEDIKIEVWTREDYIKNIMNNSNIKLDCIYDMWDKVSKGWNFVIAIYKWDISKYDIYSVDGYNKVFDTKYQRVKE